MHSEIFWPRTYASFIVDGAEQSAVSIDEKQLRSPDGGTRDM